MSPDEKQPIEENEAPKETEHVVAQDVESAQDDPLNKEAFNAQMQRLAERARAAGLSPIRALAQSYAKQGMAIVEGLLLALAHEDDSKKRKE